MKRDVKRGSSKEKGKYFKNPKLTTVLNVSAIIYLTTAIILFVVSMMLVYAVPYFQFAGITVMNRVVYFFGTTILDMSGTPGNPAATILLFIFFLPAIMTWSILLIIDKILYRRKQKAKESKMNGTNENANTTPTA